MIFININRLKFKIIKIYVDALKFAHINRDYLNFSIFNSSLLQRHIREIKKNIKKTIVENVNSLFVIFC